MTIKLCAAFLFVSLIAAGVTFARADAVTQSLLVGTAIGLVIGCITGACLALALRKPRTSGMGGCVVKPHDASDYPRGYIPRPPVPEPMHEKLAWGKKRDMEVRR